MKEKPIYIAAPYLPPIEVYNSALERIWATGILTNNGPLVQELEEKLKEYLDLEEDCEIILTSNGTKALEVAAHALGEFEEYLTTPFSFVATVGSLKWIGKKEVKFVDIDPQSWCVSNHDLEKVMFPKKKTLGVFTHVFGNPCEIFEIEKIFKDSKGSKIIYDAAHSFGVKYNGKSIFSYGDISIASFHATKIFHTIEGGAIFCKDKELAKKVRSLINFGIVDGELKNIGTNAKMSEFNAAMGLILLGKNKEIQKIYENNYKYYKERLANKFTLQKINVDSDWNYSYCPLLAKSEQHLENIFKELEKINVIARRYFYPSLNKVEYMNGAPCEVSEDVSNRVFCIPVHTSLVEKKRKEICSILENMYQ